MDLFFARNRLSAYLDGALPEAEATEVAAAIERDPALRAEYEDMRRAIDILRRVGPTEAPAGFHARVMAQVADEPLQGGKLFWLRRPLYRVPTEALALVAAALVVVLVIQGQPENAPTATVQTDMAPDVSGEEISEPQADDAEQAGPRPAPQKEATVQQRSSGTDAGAVVPQLAQGAGDLGDVASSGTGAGGLNQAPAQAHFAEWEEQQQVALGSDLPEDPKTSGIKLTSGAFGYRLNVTDPEVLAEVSRVAQAAGGYLADASGKRIGARTLSSDDNFLRVRLIVPKGSASSVRNALDALGGMSVPASASGPLVTADQIMFDVEVQYLP